MPITVSSPGSAHAVLTQRPLNRSDSQASRDSVLLFGTKKLAILKDTLFKQAGVPNPNGSHTLNRDKAKGVLECLKFKHNKNTWISEENLKVTLGKKHLTIRANSTSDEEIKIPLTNNRHRVYPHNWYV
jgi:hypothetical protein